MKISKNSKIFVAGHNGLVGSAICRYLEVNKFSNVITSPRSKLDLRDLNSVNNFYDSNTPDVVFLAAAKVGGISANISYPVEFMLDNMQIQNNILSASHKFNVKKIIFLGSNCMYPKDCVQPMRETDLFTGPLEPTNEGFAIAKLSGLRLSQFYSREYGLDTLNLIPCSLYGPNDSFESGKSHVICATIKKYCDAILNEESNVTMWGSGIARREYMHVDDLVRAIFLLLENWQSSEPVNIGLGEDISISELSRKISNLTGFTGQTKWDKSKPDGMLKKLLDNSIIRSLGFKPKIDLDSGLKGLIEIYRSL